MGLEAGQRSSEGRSAWTRRILEAAAVIRSVHTADRADVVRSRSAAQGGTSLVEFEAWNIEFDAFSLCLSTPYINDHISAIRPADARSARRHAIRFLR